MLLVTLRGLSAEIAKNIVLAGIGNLTLLDDQSVQEEDLGANFFLREDDVGKFVSFESILRQENETLTVHRSVEG